MGYNLKKVTPMANGVITTANKEIKKTESGLILSNDESAVSTLQTIISVGLMANARGLEPGMVVVVNFNRYLDTTQKKDAYNVDKDEHYTAEKFYKIPQLILNGEECLCLYDNDIEYIVDEYEQD